MKAKELLEKYKKLLNQRNEQIETFNQEKNNIDLVMNPMICEVDQIELFIVEIEQVIADELPKKLGRKPGSKDRLPRKTKSQAKHQSTNTDPSQTPVPPLTG